MALSRISRRVLEWLGRPLRAEQSANVRAHGPRTHVIILDGTMSTLEPGRETHAGILYRLCLEMSPAVSVYYEAGIQWTSWRNTVNVLVGKGLNAQIRRAYGCLASRYRPGDRIILIGFSRGAYAVRSLAGVIDMVGLVRAEHANVRNIRTAYRHYECPPDSDAARAFRRIHCHDEVPIEMVGVWDTVKALGLRLPILWRFAVARHAFHNHQPAPSIRNGFHALAMNAPRMAFTPVMWTCPPDWPGHVEQVWFRGAHGDVGGQLGGHEVARPLANVPLVWMLDRAEGCGLPLPDNWRARFHADARAPSVGSWRGWAKIFLIRKSRTIGADRSERLHESVTATASGRRERQPDPTLTT